jgi:hypothetical protein
LRAKYNEYGSVRNVEKGTVRDVWFEAFQLDLVEQGVGDNSCHDVAIKKNMNLEQMLEAVWEGRLTVRDRDIPRVRLPKEFRDTEKIPKGVPTLRRIEKIITEMGEKVSTGSGGPGYLVDRIVPGEIRIRWGEYGGSGIRKLERVQETLQDRYATMLSCGSGSYAQDAEVLVRPKPGTLAAGGEHHFTIHYERKRHPLLISQAMIREDVWQAMLTLQIDRDFGRSKKGVEFYRKEARAAWQKYKELFKKHKEEIAPDARGIFGRIEFESWASSHGSMYRLAKSEVVTGVGRNVHWQLMAEKEHLTQDEIDKFLDTVAEMLFIENLLATCRYTWRPSYSAGPQYGEFDKHHALLSAFAKVAAERHREAKAERKKYI